MDVAVTKESVRATYTIGPGTRLDRKGNPFGDDSDDDEGETGGESSPTHTVRNSFGHEPDHFKKAQNQQQSKTPSPGNNIRNSSSSREDWKTQGQRQPLSPSDSSSSPKPLTTSSSEGADTEHWLNFCCGCMVESDSSDIQEVNEHEAKRKELKRHEVNSRGSTVKTVEPPVVNPMARNNSNYSNNVNWNDEL